MDTNNFYVMLEKEWFYNKEEPVLLQEYNTDALMVYTILLRNITTRNTFTLNLDYIYSTLNIVKKDNSRMVTKIKKSIRMLNHNLFTVCLDSNCNIVADISKMDSNITYYCIRKDEPLKDKFLMVYDKEINELIKYSKGKKNSVADLITHYLFICNGFNNSIEDDGYLCYFGSLENIEKKIGIEQSTLISNNKIFIKLNLLLIDNVGGSIRDNQYKNASNVYARSDNVIQFNKFMEIKKETVSKIFESKADRDLQNEQRRLKQLINNWLKQEENNLPTFLLSVEKYKELQGMESDYLRLVLSRGKEVPKLITIDEDGTLKEQYDYKPEIPEFVASVNNYDSNILCSS